MRVILKYISILLMVFALWACPWNGYDYPEGKLPEYPVNLEDFNSEYDDYNSTAPSLGSRVPFCYSTNSRSMGADFNIKYLPLSVSWDKSTGDLTVGDPYIPKNGHIEDEFAILQNALWEINSTSNELGPYLIYSPDDEFYDAELVLLYATDLDGDFDVGYTYNNEGPEFSESLPVAFLNSEFNDLYPTFNPDFSRIYFCSDREGGIYHIYYVDVEYRYRQIIGILSDSLDKAVELEQVLSSDYDDKCPYIFGETLVFTSNRPGGSGGFDLYYSKFIDGSWSDPVNFGAGINTVADEYRPILFDAEVDNDRDMMIFSSNRSGGKGGFDLYYVGIPVEE